MKKVLLAVCTTVFLVTGCVSVAPSTSGTSVPGVTAAPSLGVASLPPFSIPPLPTLALTPTPAATPTVAPTLPPFTVPPAPSVSPQPTLGGTTEPTELPSGSPTESSPAGSPVAFSDRDLVFTDDMSDPASGWSTVNESFETISYDAGALAFRFNQDTAWAMSPRKMDLPNTTITLAAQFLPQSKGYMGSVCGDATGDYYGAAVGTDGSLVFFSIVNSKVKVLDSQPNLGLDMPIGQVSGMVLECSVDQSGDVYLVVDLSETGPVAVHIESTDVDTFSYVGLYAEAASTGYTLAVDNAAVYGVGGSDGTMSEGAQGVLSHIPDDFQQNCFEGPLFQSAATFIVTCIPQTSGTGAELEQYEQYASQEDMDTVYQNLVSGFGVPSTGTCQSGPNEEQWTFNGGTVGGRVQCAPQTVGIRFDWTDETTNILSTLIDFDGSYSDTYNQWVNAGPV